MTLLAKAEEMERQRKELIHTCKELSHKLREALENEYRDLIVDKQRFSPSDAARFVAKHQEQAAWIPGPVKFGALLPLLTKSSRAYMPLANCSQSQRNVIRGIHSQNSKHCRRSSVLRRWLRNIIIC